MGELKSILKPRVENKNTGRHTATNSNSWFSRLQSRLHQGEDDENNPVILLQRHDLKKVSFSVGNLTTEHWFCCNDSPKDEKYEQQLKEQQRQNSAPIKTQQLVDMKNLATFYEHACIQREESIFEYFRNILRKNRSSTIDLTNQMITVQQAGPISDILTLRFGLTHLNLTDCKLNDEAIRLLLCGLIVSNSVTHLYLAKNNFKTKGYKYIAVFMKESKVIQFIDLSRCTIERRGIQYIAQGLEYATSLKTLILNDCILKQPHTFDPLAHSVLHSHSLSRLSLRNITPFAAPWMSFLVAESGNSLTHLDLSGNNLHYTIGSLAHALKDNTAILELTLSNCQITHEGLTYLAEALIENNCLQSLDLSNNPLCGETDEGILALKRALARNISLESLNLSNTQLDPPTTIALAEILPENVGLSSLDLTRNPSIDIAGLLALSLSIKMNHTLTFLDINIPPSDEELANLQNDIVTVCTTNMLKKVEAQQAPTITTA